MVGILRAPTLEDRKPIMSIDTWVTSAQSSRMYTCWAQAKTNTPRNFYMTVIVKNRCYLFHSGRSGWNFRENPTRGRRMPSPAISFYLDIGIGWPRTPAGLFTLIRKLLSRSLDCPRQSWHLVPHLPLGLPSIPNETKPVHAKFQR